MTGEPLLLPYTPLGVIGLDDDNFFTSIPLMVVLKANGLTLVGTVRKKGFYYTSIVLNMLYFFSPKFTLCCQITTDYFVIK